jgi:acyl-CoA thioesterase-1
MQNTTVIEGESGMFAGKDYVRLLFPAKEMPVVYNSTTGWKYEAGRDFRLSPDARALWLTQGSRIPHVLSADLHPAPETCVFYPDANHNAIKGGLDGGALLFNNLSYFARQQIEIDYFTSEYDFPALPCYPERLLRCKQRLHDPRRECKIVCLGDSITDGYNASGRLDFPPHQPCYAELLGQRLSACCPGKVIIRNLGVNGTSSLAAVQAPELWLPENPDLLLIAYGMNDFHRMSAGEFADVVRRLIRLAEEANPAVECLLIASMPGNPLWANTPPAPARDFAAALRELAAQESATACADVHAVWQELLQRKDFYDLTGNGVNHPNDFGHRVYAETILALIMDRTQLNWTR